MTVTTLADVEAALLRSLTSEELAYVTRIIEMVEADVLHRLPGYDLEPASADTVTIDGHHDNVLTLPQYPVSAVSAVLVDGGAPAADEWTWTEDGFLLRHHHTSGRSGWGYPGVVGVTYTHGQTAAGSPLGMLLAEAVAARLMSVGRTGLRSMSIDTTAYSETYQAASLGLASGVIDAASLAPYSRMIVV